MTCCHFRASEMIAKAFERLPAFKKGNAGCPAILVSSLSQTDDDMCRAEMNSPQRIREADFEHFPQCPSHPGAQQPLLLALRGSCSA